jgi:hypothetical protein
MDDRRIGDGMARIGSSNAVGKLTEDIRAKVDVETKEELERLAFDAGMNTSEFLREMVMIRVYGREHVARLHKARLDVVAGKGQNED